MMRVMVKSRDGRDVYIVEVGKAITVSGKARSLVGTFRILRFGQPESFFTGGIKGDTARLLTFAEYHPSLFIEWVENRGGNYPSHDEEAIDNALVNE